VDAPEPRRQNSGNLCGIYPSLISNWSAFLRPNCDVRPQDRRRASSARCRIRIPRPDGRPRVDFLPYRNAIAAFITSFAEHVLFVDDGGWIDPLHMQWAEEAASASRAIVAIVSTADRGRWLVDEPYCDGVWN